MHLGPISVRPGSHWRRHLSCCASQHTLRRVSVRSAVTMDWYTDATRDASSVKPVCDTSQRVTL